MWVNKHKHHDKNTERNEKGSGVKVIYWWYKSKWANVITFVSQCRQWCTISQQIFMIYIFIQGYTVRWQGYTLLPISQHYVFGAVLLQVIFKDWNTKKKLKKSKVLSVLKKIRNRLFSPTEHKCVSILLKQPSSLNSSLHL